MALLLLVRLLGNVSTLIATATIELTAIFSIYCCFFLCCFGLYLLVTITIIVFLCCYGSDAISDAVGEYLHTYFFLILLLLCCC